jgi:hypothetical protein
MNGIKKWWHREVPQVETEGEEAAREEFLKAIEAHKRIDMFIDETKPVMDELKEHRQVNHFTSLFQEAIYGRKESDEEQ